MENKKCPHCSDALTGKERFCPHCGRPLEVSSETAARYNWAMEDLFEVAQALTSTLDLDALLKKIGYVAERLTNAEASSIMLLSEDRAQLYFKVASGEKSHILKRHSMPSTQGIAGWVATHGEPLVVNDAAHDERFARQMDDVTGFVTRSLLAVPLMVGGEVIGVCEAINKRGAGAFDDKDKAAFQKMANLAAVSVMNARASEDQQNFFTNMIEIMITAIEASLPNYTGHPARVAELSCSIGRRLGVQGAGYKTLYYGALLHDVGMIAIRHKTLIDKVSLLARDRTPERMHPALGVEMLKNIKMIHPVLPLVRHHHERWDGMGYPDGLAGEAIPLGARIIGLVEDLEEIRLAGAPENELLALQQKAASEGAGIRYDPKVVEAFLGTFAEVVS